MSDVPIRDRDRHNREFRRRVQDHQPLFGTFLNMGSAASAEVCGTAGFDWALIDLEHGLGSEAMLLHELHALELTGAAALVRVETAEQLRISRALDHGASGIVVPRVRSAVQAQMVVNRVRYPPEGSRGVATSSRAAGYGALTHDGVRSVNETITTLIQIENGEALAEAEAIAAVDGVDVLFVGPNDLTHTLGIPGRFEDRRYLEALATVTAATRAAGKASGILIRTVEEFDSHLQMGFSVLAMGSDSGMLGRAARDTVNALRAVVAR